MAQDVERALLDRQSRGLERRQADGDAAYVAVHARRLAEQHVHRHVDRRHGVGPPDDEVAVRGDLADDGVRRALATADPVEGGESIRRHRKRIAFLRFVAPDLERTHAALLDRNLCQVDMCTAVRLIGEFRQRIGQSTRTHVMDRQHRIAVAQRPAAVDDFLCTTLDLGIAALDGVEVERFGVGAGAHAGRRAAAETDAHARTAELHQQRARRQVELAHLIVTDAADATRDHDRLVITVALAGHVLLVGTEVAEQVRPSELVVECRGADRPFDHDRERVCDAPREAVVRLVARCGTRDVAILLPRQRHVRDAQVRDREAGQSRFRLRAATGGALVADLAARPGGRARKGSDCRRMVVRFDLE